MPGDQTRSVAALSSCSVQSLNAAGTSDQARSSAYYSVNQPLRSGKAASHAAATFSVGGRFPFSIRDSWPVLMPGPRGELAQRPAARQPLLAHLPPEVRCRVTAVVYRHTDNVATALPVAQPAAAR